VRYVRPLIVLVGLLGFPAAAVASAPATQSQKRALEKALGDGQVPARCLTARISTANRSFAEIYFTGLWGAPRPMPSGCEKYAANGVSIFRYRAGRWRGVTAGSSFVTSSGGCRVPHVPKPVIEDFRLCGSLTPHSVTVATMTAPSHARVGARITVRADGLKPGCSAVVQRRKSDGLLGARGCCVGTRRLADHLGQAPAPARVPHGRRAARGVRFRALGQVRAQSRDPSPAGRFPRGKFRQAHDQARDLDPSRSTATGLAAAAARRCRRLWSGAAQVAGRYRWRRSLPGPEIRR